MFDFQKGNFMGHGLGKKQLIKAEETNFFCEKTNDSEKT